MRSKIAKFAMKTRLTEPVYSQTDELLVKQKKKEVHLDFKRKK